MYKDKKIAFVFPGQGSQYVGMAGDFIVSDAEMKKVAEDFSQAMGFDLLDVMQNGPEEKLAQTEFTQPSVLFHSYLALRAFLKEVDIAPDFVAGHSLGEFSALVASGVLNINDALALVHKRGKFMASAGEGNNGGMCAIVGLGIDEVEKICAEASADGLVAVVANFNSPVQVVASGHGEAVQKVAELAKSAGAKRALPLAVSCAFHSPLMKSAAENLAKELDKIEFKEGFCSVVSNVDAELHSNVAEIKKNLIKQVDGAVLWTSSVEKMLAEGVEVFIEFGPGKAVSGMIKKTDKKVTVMNVAKVEDVAEVVAKLNEL